MLDFGCWLNPAAAHESTNIQHPKSNIYVKDLAATVALFVAISRRFPGGFPGAGSQGLGRCFGATDYSRGGRSILSGRSGGADLAFRGISDCRCAAARSVSVLDAGG